MGAAFVQYFALMEEGGRSGPPAAGVERFCFVLEGAVEARGHDAPIRLDSGGYVYTPPDRPIQLTAVTASRLVVFEKRFVPGRDGTMLSSTLGHERDVVAAPFLGDPAAMLKVLLPSSPTADMEVNLFTFSPGGCLPLVEVHWMEHGLLLLEGQGIYRLDDRWYPVQAGDVIWMGPFCSAMVCRHRQAAGALSLLQGRKPRSAGRRRMSAPAVSIQIERLMAEIEYLSRLSDTPAPAVTRVLYTPMDLAARRYLQDLADAGGFRLVYRRCRQQLYPLARQPA